jgi:carbonic anhydrase
MTCKDGQKTSIQGWKFSIKEGAVKKAEETRKVLEEQQ